MKITFFIDPKGPRVIKFSIWHLYNTKTSRVIKKEVMKNKQPLKNRLVLLKFEIIFSIFLGILVLQKIS
jgi:hypothetical protein